MSKTVRKKKVQKPGKHTPVQSKAAVTLTEKDLEQVQGGSGGSNSAYKELKGD
jgi:bacteriocin-like protein